MTMTKKEAINEYMDQFPELVELFGFIINQKQDHSYKPIMEFLFTKEQNNKIDSAVPCDYARQIEIIYPNFRKGYNVFDYNTEKFGAMRNLKNDFFDKVLEPLQF